MQVTMLDDQEFARFITEASVLLKLEGPGSSETFVVAYSGSDMIAVTSSTTGGAAVIGPDDASDEGSIHDSARRL